MDLKGPQSLFNIIPSKHSGDFTLVEREELDKMFNLTDNDNENILFDHNIQIYITDLQ